MNEKYYYSEGYVYQGVDTICKVFGTANEQKQTGEFIARSLNLRPI